MPKAHPSPDPTEGETDSEGTHLQLDGQGYYGLSLMRWALASGFDVVSEQQLMLPNFILDVEAHSGEGEGMRNFMLQGPFLCSENA